MYYIIKIQWTKQTLDFLVIRFILCSDFTFLCVFKLVHTYFNAFELIDRTVIIE